MGPIARDAAEQSKTKAVIEIDPPLDLQPGDDDEQMSISHYPFVYFLWRQVYIQIFSPLQNFIISFCILELKIFLYSR